MKIWFKKVTSPQSNETKEIDAIQLWKVQWTSRHGPYSSDTSQEFEAFTSEEQANEFATALRNAFELIKHTSGKKVVVTKN